MLAHAWLPWTESTVLLSRSLTVGRGRSSMVLAISLRSPATQAASGRSLAGARSLASLPGLPSEPHPVRVAMVVGALVHVPRDPRRPRLAEDDDTCRAAVDAQRAARADVVVDREDHVVRRILARPLGADGLDDRLGLDHVDALP